jgi:hypothetical protein
MTKTYIKTGAVYRSVMMQIPTDKGERSVEFGGGMLNLSNPNCFFTTSDKSLQEALEKSEFFNADNGFVLLSSDVEEKPEPKGKEVKEVKDFASAKAYILKNHKDYTQADVSTAEKVTAIATELGISFPNWIIQNV